MSQNFRPIDHNLFAVDTKEKTLYFVIERISFFQCTVVQAYEIDTNGPFQQFLLGDSPVILVAGETYEYEHRNGTKEALFVFWGYILGIELDEDCGIRYFHVLKYYQA